MSGGGNDDKPEESGGRTPPVMSRDEAMRLFEQRQQLVRRSGEHASLSSADALNSLQERSVTGLGSASMSSQDALSILPDLSGVGLSGRNNAPDEPAKPSELLGAASVKENNEGEPAVFVPDERRVYGDRELLVRNLRDTSRYWPSLVGLVLAYLIAVPLAMALPIPFAIGLDFVLGGKELPDWIVRVLPEMFTSSPEGILRGAVLLLFMIAVFQQIHGITTKLLHTWTAEHMVLEFRARMFRHVQMLSLAYHDRIGSADTLYRIQYDAKQQENVVLGGIMRLLSPVLTLAAMIVTVMWIDYILAFTVFMLAPALVVFTQLFRAPLRRVWTEHKERDASAMQAVNELLSALRVVLAFGQEAREQKRFVDRSKGTIRTHLRGIVVEGLYGICLTMVVVGGTGAVFYLGVRHVQEGLVTIGQLTVVTAYILQLWGPVKVVSQTVAVIQNALASADRVYRLLDEEPRVKEPEEPVPLYGYDRVHGRIEFRNVCFSYSPEHLILDGISFSVEPGSTVGIAGPTGSGKSTLINLLPRLYDPDAGAVLVNGVDIRRYSLEELRRQFSIVPQENILMAGSIADNIAYGKPDATRAEVINAARTANAHDFIERQSHGYDTQVGELGRTLSGGQRQLIALARAFLRDAPILILDEPTSSVDVATEGAVIDALERLQEGRTTFTIAHRLNTLSRCDVMLVLDKGRLVRLERGEQDLTLGAEAQLMGREGGA